MNTTSLVKRAALSAVGVYAYIALLAVLVQHSLFGASPPWWLGASLGLTIFVISASVTGSLVLLKPLTLYLDGNKRDALRLFVYTIAALACIAVLVALVLVSAFL